MRIQPINQYLLPKRISPIESTFFHIAHVIMAIAKILGYILLILRLYQLSNLIYLPRNIVKPEAKKNNASPIALLLPEIHTLDSKSACVNS